MAFPACLKTWTTCAPTGKDERIGVKDFYDGVDFYYEFIKSLGAP